MGLVTDEEAKSWRSKSRYNALAAVPAGGLRFYWGILRWDVSGGCFFGGGGVIWFYEYHSYGNLVFKGPGFVYT